MASYSSCIALFVLLCVVAPAFSISFNATFSNDCVTPVGCSFFNASIWEGGVVPSANSDVNITGNWTVGGPVLYIYVDTSSNVPTLKSLTIQAASFSVLTNNTISINGSVNINDNATLSVAVNSTFSTAGTLNLVATGSLTSSGVISALDAVILGAIQVSTPLQVSNLVFGSTSYTLVGFVGNSISILPEITFVAPVIQVSNFSVGTNSTVTFPSTASILAQLQIAQGASVVASGFLTVGTTSAIAPLAGNGSLSIQDSAIIVSAEGSPAFAGSVYVLDEVVVSLLNVTLNNLVTAATSTVYVQGVSLPGSTVVNGHLGVTNSNIKFGEVILTGNLTLTNSTLTVSTLLQIVNDWSLLLEYSERILGGQVTGNLTIPANSTLSVSSTNATVLGRFSTYGSLKLSGKNHLSVFGDAILNDQGTLYADLTGENDAVLIVYGGLLALDGNLIYNIDKKPILKSVTYLVADTNNGTLNGTTFNQETAAALAGSKITRDLPIEYTITSVSVKYGWNLKDTQWWLWLLLGVGIAVVLGITIGVVIKCRSRRADYQPVR